MFYPSEFPVSRFSHYGLPLALRKERVRERERERESKGENERIGGEGRGVLKKDFFVS